MVTSRDEEFGFFPNNQSQHRTLHIQKCVLPSRDECLASRHPHTRRPASISSVRVKTSFITDRNQNGRYGIYHGGHWYMRDKNFPPYWTETMPKFDAD